MRKFLAISLISILTLGSAQTALAEVIYHNLSEKGSLNITNSGDEYIVTSDGVTSNVVTVSNGVKTYIVLQGVTIQTTNKNGILIGEKANVVLELDGTNSIGVDDGAFAGINVANGSLTIKDENNDGSLEVATSYNSSGAAIGSDGEQNFSGTIIIEGGDITAESEYGAGIGSGYESKMSGSVTISGGTVNAESKNSSAGIGSGYYGDMSGSINISDGDVYAESTCGAAIGSAGGYGSDMSGSINISGGNVNAYSNCYGAAIGAGDYGSITESGSITIGGDADVTAESTYGLGIGSGGNKNMNGSIVITDNASVDITMYDTDTTIGLGASNNIDYKDDYSFNGSIGILEHASVNMRYDDPDTDYIPGIGIEGGSATGTITLSTGSFINGVSGADIEKLREMGILDDVTKIISVDPSSEPVESYSLTPLNLKQRIDKAQAGDTVSVSESQLSKGKLPSYVLEALALKEDVTLAIFCEEFTILIPSDEAVADAGSKQFYTIDELVKMYE